MRRSAPGLIVTLAVAALAGCYGSTEPATEVGIDSATLNGRGTANNGPAHSYFEYWLTGAEENHLRAGDRDWPAGASGPINAKVTGLAAASSYSFRICGYDVTPEGGGPEACAQTHTFTTKPPVEDSVRGGFYAGCCSRVDVDARSGPTGANPRGFFRWYARSSSSPDPPSIFNGFVTCLAVNGSRAAVGAVGKWSRQGSPDTNATLLVTIVDGRTEEDTYHHVETAGSTPPICANADFSHQSPLIIRSYEFIVNDAQ